MTMRRPELRFLKLCFTILEDPSRRSRLNEFQVLFSVLWLCGCRAALHRCAPGRQFCCKNGQIRCLAVGTQSALHVSCLMYAPAAPFRLRSGLFQIHEENKASCTLIVTLKSTSTCGQGDLNPDPLYSWYHFSHPPLVRPPRCFTFFTV